MKTLFTKPLRHYKHLLLFLGMFVFMFLAVFIITDKVYTEDDFEFNGYLGDIYEQYGNFRICNPLEVDRSRYIYAILHMMITDTDEAIEDIPRYLRLGMKEKESEGVKTNNYYPVLRYIKYPEMKKLIALIYDDAVATKGGKASKWDFIEELTGYLFTPDGDPIIDEEGKTQKRRTRYEDLFKLDETEMMILTKSLLDGCYNPDPRIRLTCIAVLEGFGPHPMMKDAVLYGMSLETIGDMFQNFPFDPKNVRKYRHRYANINGCEEDDIPYRRFSMFERKISRLELCYHIEKVKDIFDDDFASMNSALFVTLTDDLSVNPFFPPMYDNEITAEDYYIPTEIYSRKEGVYKYLARNSLIELNENNTPSVRKKSGKSNEVSYVSSEDKTIVKVNAKFVSKDEAGKTEGDLSREEFLRIVNLFVGGLNSNDYVVQQKCASFLSKVYSHPDLDESLKTYILTKVREAGLCNLDTEKDLNTIPKKVIKVKTE